MAFFAAAFAVALVDAAEPFVDVPVEPELARASAVDVLVDVFELAVLDDAVLDVVPDDEVEVVAVLDDVPPFELVRPATFEQTGQAFGPWTASTFWAMAICWALVARSARDAYCVPPNSFHVLAENCRPP